MSFTKIKEELEKLKPDSYYEFDLALIKANLNEQLDDFFKIVNNQINLYKISYKEISSDVIYFSGEVHVKYSPTFFEIRITLIDNGNLDYIITVEPNGKWLDEVDVNIRRILDFLPVGFGETMFINSSLDLSKTTIDFGEGKVYELAINKGSAIISHIKSDLLKLINLSDTVFFIERSSEGVYNIFKEIKLNIDLADILNIDLDRIQLLNKDSLSVEGKLNLPFPNGETLTTDSLFSISKENYYARVKIADEVRLPIQTLLKGLNIANVELDLQGSFTNPNEFTYGIAGDFAIGKPVTHNNEHDFSYETLNTNEFNLKFTPTTSSYIPVFIQAYIEEVSLNEAITLITGKAVDLPDFLNPVKFYSTYFYYCSPTQNEILINGIEAKKGLAISSGISILGLKAYGEFNAIEGKSTSGYLQVQPINIGDVLKITGKSKGTPAGYLGPSVEPGGVEMYFNSNGPDYFGTDVHVEILNTLKFDGGAKYTKSGLSFYHNINLGAFRMNLSCTLENINNFNIESLDNKVPIIGLNADLGDLGKLKINLDVQLDFKFEIKNNIPKTLLDFTFTFNGQEFTIAKLDFDFKQIYNLGDFIADTILKYIENLIKDPLEWLKAIFEGAIEIVGNLLEEAKKIANTLVNVFGEGAENAVILMKNAQFEINKTIHILNNGFNASVEQTAMFLKNAKYTALQISQGLENEFKKGAVEICKILEPLFKPKEIGQAMTRFTNEVVDNIKELKDVFSEENLGAVLNGLGKTTSEAGDILHKALGIGRSTLGTILNGGGYIASEVKDTLDRIFGGGGSCTRRSMCIEWDLLTGRCTRTVSVCT